MLIDAIDIGTPEDLGLPAAYRAWRPGQKDALARALSWSLEISPRFMAMCMPTGSGKSLTYLALAKQAGRTCILTSTKGLQDQLMRDFAQSGLVDIRGQGNYECLAHKDLPMYHEPGDRTPSCEDGPCHGGFKCDLQQAGCTYFDSKRVAQSSSLVVTNYSYWLRVMNQEKADAGLGSFDLLILDEAHEAPDELAGYLSIEIGAAELEQILNEDIPDIPSDSNEFGRWKEWAKNLSQRLDGMVQSEEESGGQLTKSRVRYMKALKNLQQRMNSVANARGRWVQESYRDYRGSRKIRFDPVDVKEYASEMFQTIPHILFVSATVRPKTLDLLGATDSIFMESQHAFAPNRRPVIHVPTVRMRHGMTNEEMRWWVTKIDQIIDRRPNVKGIVHTTSYKRAEFLFNNSAHAHKMILPKGANVRETVMAFKKTNFPAVLVSPSVTTGWDFPGDECRYQIIGKIPFTDTRSKILQAREETDKDYGNYIAMQTLVQTCGRGCRSADDWCENLVVDDQFLWFIRKYKQFAPQWFLKAVRYSTGVPDALKL